MNLNFEKIQSYLSSIDKIEYKNGWMILYCETEKYLYRKKGIKLDELFHYFESISFFNYLMPLNSLDDDFVLYHYPNEVSLDEEEKGRRMLFVLLSLEKKSIIQRELSIDEKKELYENICNDIEETVTYYLDLEKKILEFDFPPISYYVLLNNISQFYRLLDYSRYQLNRWYSSESNLYRESFLVGDVSINSFVFSDDTYLYGIDQWKRGCLLLDFLSFFKNNSSLPNIWELFHSFQEELSLTKEELSLFYSLISIPEKIEFSHHSFIDTMILHDYIQRLDSIEMFLSKENEKNEKAD